MTEFFDDLSVLVEDLTVFPGRFALVGDFNIHYDDLLDRDAQKMQNALSAACFKQHVVGSTHKHGHTLDLVISRDYESLISKTFVIHGMPSDHSAVRCNLDFSQPKPAKHVVTSRKLRDIDLDKLRSDIDKSSLCIAEDRDLLFLTTKYNSVLCMICLTNTPPCLSVKYLFDLTLHGTTTACVTQKD